MRNETRSRRFRGSETCTQTPKADQVNNEFRRKLHELLAPDTFPIEVAHALAKAERRRISPQAHADKLLTEVLSPPPQLHSYGSGRE
jgi:hypothetical protein